MPHKTTLASMKNALHIGENFGEEDPYHLLPDLMTEEDLEAYLERVESSADGSVIREVERVAARYKERFIS